jgi:hypothetical protein
LASFFMRDLRENNGKRRRGCWKNTVTNCNAVMGPAAAGRYCRELADLPVNTEKKARE